MWKARPIWPPSAAAPGNWPRLAAAPGGLRHELALRAASVEPAGRRLSNLVFHIGYPYPYPNPTPNPNPNPNPTPGYQVDGVAMRDGLTAWWKAAALTLNPEP